MSILFFYGGRKKIITENEEIIQLENINELHSIIQSKTLNTFEEELIVKKLNDTQIKKNKLYSYYKLFWITCTLFFSFILNANSFELELNGPTVEKLTPFLGFMTLPFFFIFGKF